MKLIYISTPELGDNQESRKRIRRYCEYLRYEGIPLCGSAIFSVLDEHDRTGWYREARGVELAENSSEVYVFADEVTELVIKEIRAAQKKGVKVHFHDADCKEINYDALVINTRIGPGYRKIIAEANGEACCSGVCPYGLDIGKETDAAPESLASAGAHDVENTSDKSEQAEKAKAPSSLLHRLFGKR